MHRIKINGVESGSIAGELGIEAGDFLISVNGSEIRDIFDYRILTTEESLVIEIEKPDGQFWSLDIEKDEAEDVGLEFENSLMDEEKSCRNNCVFCFIDQLPPGMRETLYYKDDDARLSFLFGNYITMTNLDNDGIDRIVRYRMSPVNISVHTTNPDLRIKMLNNRFAGDIMDKIRRFTESGIEVNCQVVVCPGLNDGRELDRTIRELSELYPQMHSISVVPVGLTRYREGLHPLEPFNTETALNVVLQVETWQSALIERYGSRVVYLSDEFYLMAGKELPDYEDYEDFPQIENGVGMVASFSFEVEQALSKMDPLQIVHTKRIGIATGTAFYPIMRDLAGKTEARMDGLKLIVHAVESDFFGGKVTVTGLLTGHDLLKGLAGKDLGEELLVCRNMFRSGTEAMLDDVTLSDLSVAFGLPVRIIDNNGEAFVSCLME